MQQLHDQAQQAQQATFAAHLEAQQVEKVQIVSKPEKGEKTWDKHKNRKTPIKRSRKKSPRRIKGTVIDLKA